LNLTIIFLTGPKKRKVAADDDEASQFHEQLKASVIHNIVTVQDDSMPSEPSAILEQIKEFHSAANYNNRQTVYMHCLMGRNLDALKKNKAEDKDFIADVQKKLPKEYSRSQIYFLIDLHKLANVYNNIMFLSFPIGQLKSKFSLVKQLVRRDKDFWKHSGVV